MKSLFTRVLVLTLVLAGGSWAMPTARAESAMDQLNRATNGTQHQGTTFDGSKEPRGGLDVPVSR
jgi:hypothetical protein